MPHRGVNRQTKLRRGGTTTSVVSSPICNASSPTLPLHASCFSSLCVSSITAFSSVLWAFRHCFSFIYAFGGQPLLGLSLFLLLLAVELQLRRLYTHGCMYMHQLTSALHQPLPTLPPDLSADCFYLWVLTFGGVVLAGVSFLHHLLSSLMAALRPAVQPEDINQQLRSLFASSDKPSDVLSPPSGSTAATAGGELHALEGAEAGKPSADWWQGKSHAQVLSGRESCWSSWSPSAYQLQQEPSAEGLADGRQTTEASLCDNLVSAGASESEEKVKLQESLRYSRSSVFQERESPEEPESFYIGDSDNEG
eukprot:GHVS01105058.1.p1 GENE.GHVS01105058.1~~GHVS01105058.1.p1  ORF type:complete len:338 (+),score=50.74 GHVS01105058.1:90-1016(+)